MARAANRKWHRLALAASALALLTPATAPAQSVRERPPEDEVVYFVLPDRFENGDPGNDRGGIAGDRLDHGFDPAHKGFYLGGDLAGLTEKLDYIEGMGATAIWLGPIYKNKPVQGPPGQESSGYHGYWINDFTQVDPHFGTRADMKAFVDAAHARGMKVYLDIITNHTADVIRFRECPGWDCHYRPRAEYPYSTRGDVNGERINEGFLGDAPQHQTVENFAKLSNPNFAYTPHIPKGEERVKVPAWLNDPIYYHNRGNSSFRNEDSLYGDFSGLDDLFTEHPTVVAGMIDIFGDWIDEFGIDGFRIDTARHVNPEFWQAFVPAMLARAEAKGIPNFHIFGEVFDGDPAALARHTRVDKLPTVLDFAFQGTVTDVVARGAPTDRLARLFQADALYEGGFETALKLPTFLGNHDMGRFARFVREGNPKADDAEVLKRVILGHAMMFFSRGVPVIYSGDEQGFAGDGGDQDARETLFPSKVAVYNDNDLVGTDATTADANFDTDHPLYRAIGEMAAIRKADPALRHGEQIVRLYAHAPGIFALSRKGDAGGETLVVFNSSTAPITAQVEVDATSLKWEAVRGQCEASASAPGSFKVTVAPLDYLICRSGGAR